MRLGRHRIERYELIILAAFAIVVAVGALVTIIDSDALPVASWLTLVALASLPAGLMAVGHGIAEAGKQRAGAVALETAHRRGERHRPYDPQTDMPRPPAELRQSSDGY